MRQRVHCSEDWILVLYGRDDLIMGQEETDIASLSHQFLQ